MANGEKFETRENSILKITLGLVDKAEEQGEKLGEKAASAMGRPNWAPVLRKSGKGVLMSGAWFVSYFIALPGLAAFGYIYARRGIKGAYRRRQNPKKRMDSAIRNAFRDLPNQIIRETAKIPEAVASSG